MRLAAGLRAGFLAACAADLVAVLAGAGPAHTVLKALLMPLLAAYVAARCGPRLLCVALLWGWAGDVLLQADRDAAFLAGMGCFAVGHVCYLALFARNAVPRAHRWWLAGGYAIVLVGTVAVLWSGLPGGLRGPVAAYSVLLTAMAYGASRVGVVAGVGGALFLLSDSLIAFGLADRPAPPHPDFWIMVTYVAAQYLLVRGVLVARATPRAAHREGHAEIRRTPH